jgi:hypothetical protein
MPISRLHKGSKLGDRNSAVYDAVARDEAGCRLPFDRETFRARHFEVTAHPGERQSNDGIVP